MPSPAYKTWLIAIKPWYSLDNLIRLLISSDSKCVKTLGNPTIMEIYNQDPNGEIKTVIITGSWNPQVRYEDTIEFFYGKWHCLGGWSWKMATINEQVCTGPSMTLSDMNTKKSKRNNRTDWLRPPISRGTTQSKDPVQRQLEKTNSSHPIPPWLITMKWSESSQGINYLGLRIRKRDNKEKVDLARASFPNPQVNWIDFCFFLTFPFNELSVGKTGAENWNHPESPCQSLIVPLVILSQRDSQELNVILISRFSSERSPRPAGPNAQLISFSISRSIIKFLHRRKIL